MLFSNKKWHIIISKVISSHMGPIYIGTPYIFPKEISSKVNIIAWLEFELAYYDVVVQHVNHYNMGVTP